MSNRRNLIVLSAFVLLSNMGIPSVHSEDKYGEAAALQTMSVQSYFQDLFARLNRNWRWKGDPKLSCRVDFTITPEGKVKDVSFERSSDNPKFDEAVKQMLVEAQPLPPSPLPREDRLEINWPQEGGSASK